MGLDGVELVMALEESFGVELKDDEVANTVTPRMVGDLVPSAITSGNITWTREQVSTLVKQVVMEQLGVSESKYTEDSRFIEDFGID